MAKSKGAEVEGGEGFTVDLTDVEEASFELLPKGMYPVEVETLEFDYSAGKGTPMWSWVFEVSEGEFAGRKLFYHTVLAGKGLPFTKKTFARILPELLSGEFDPIAIADSGELLGKAFKVRVGIQKYEGEDRNNVRDVFPIGEGDEFS